MGCWSKRSLSVALANKLTCCSATARHAHNVCPFLAWQSTGIRFLLADVELMQR